MIESWLPFFLKKTDHTKMNIGQAIHTVRKNKKLSQTEFSELIEIDQSYLSQIENNKKRPSMKLLEKISGVTHTPLPIVLFYSLTEEDVNPRKRELYHILFPKVKEMIGDLFNQDINQYDR
jgi:transcriptional regulator with XRE-family HTH domain